MRKEHKPNGTAPVPPQADEVRNSNGENTQPIEEQIGKIIGVGWAIVNTLRSIDDSISILAAQKARELNPDEPEEDGNPS